MEFFQGRGRFSEDDEVVDMIGDMDKVPYSSSSSSNGRWGAQFYDKSQKSELKRAESDGGSGGSGSGVGGGAGGGEEEVVYIEREHMFDKVVTPSDVGKLNRLVIPKQHAEKYFPLDSTANEKGLLLNFEDRGGKPWRFRYSYWNSSQSYVMTKGWSRFVKEKKLYAGDVVSFQRGAGESVKDRLYIDWRRRSDVQDPSALPPLPILHPLSFPRSAPWGGLILPPSMPMPMSMPRGNMVWQPMNYGHIHNPNLVNSNSSPIFYLRSSSSHPFGVVQQVREADQVVFNSVPVVHGKASAKRLRLFGVNLDCPAPENTEYQFLDPVEVTHQSQFPPSIPPLQLRLYNGEPPQSESPKESQSMSLDLDI